MEIRESIFWNLIRILWQKKIIFSISILSTAVLTFIITTIMPKTYKASITFIVNQEEKGLNISTLVNDLPFNLGNMSSADVSKYIALLKSRRIKDRLINEFNLWEEYNADYIEQVYRSIDDNVVALDNMDGTITVDCYFKRDPEKAAKMAQIVYDELYQFSLALKKENATNYRIFMEQNLKNCRVILTSLEDSLKVFQLENKVLEFDEQVKLSFKVLGEMEAQNYSYKIERDLLEASVSKNNVKLKEINRKIMAIEKYIKNLENEGEKYILALDQVPEYGILYYRLKRDIMIQQEILKILLPLVENAKIEEQKSTVNIQLIDPPYVPQYKSKPKRLLYIIIIVTIVAILELLYFAIEDAYRKNRVEIRNWISHK